MQLQTERDILADIAADPWRMEVVRAAMALGLPDCWIGAGFVRNPVWDALHGRPPGHDFNDIDVVYFEPADLAPETDAAHEARLRALRPELPWSVLNMARMHLPTGDPPYRSTIDGIRFWPETATAIAIRLDADGRLELAAPFGLDDLLGLRLRPTPAVRAHHPDTYRKRLAKKNWLARWPKLEFEAI